eukprot:334709-Rhodomonas_salina.1
MASRFLCPPLPFLPLHILLIILCLLSPSLAWSPLLSLHFSHPLQFSFAAFPPALTIAPALGPISVSLSRSPLPIFPHSLSPRFHSTIKNTARKNMLAKLRMASDSAPKDPNRTFRILIADEIADQVRAELQGEGHEVIFEPDLSGKTVSNSRLSFFLRVEASALWFKFDPLTVAGQTLTSAIAEHLPEVKLNSLCSTALCYLLRYLPTRGHGAWYCRYCPTAYGAIEACGASASAGTSLHPEIKYKKPHSWLLREFPMRNSQSTTAPYASVSARSLCYRPTHFPYSPTTLCASTLRARYESCEYAPTQCVVLVSGMLLRIPCSTDVGHGATRCYDQALSIAVLTYPTVLRGHVVLTWALMLRDDAVQTQRMVLRGDTDVEDGATSRFPAECAVLTWRMVLRSVRY